MLKLPAKLPKKKRREQRVRSQGHLQFVRSHSCSVPNCEGRPIEAAHVRTVAGGAGVGIKPDDSETVSLCSTHHREQHDHGAETFEAKYRVSLADLAAMFWQQSPHRLKWERKQAA